MLIKDLRKWGDSTILIVGAGHLVGDQKVAHTLHIQGDQTSLYLR